MIKGKGWRYNCWEMQFDRFAISPNFVGAAPRASARRAAFQTCDSKKVVSPDTLHEQKARVAT